MRPATVGVVIPARDEERRIGACLASLEPFRRAGDAIVVVDDHSNDATAELSRRAGADVLPAGTPGRGFAVALGAAAIAPTVDAILVAHADMVFPAEARAALTEVLESHPEAPGGFLGHRIAARGWRFRVLEAGNRLRAAAWGLAYGDQAVFVRTAVLERVGGFPVQGGLEDLELALRLRAAGPLADACCPVSIPPRHWDRGVVATTLRNWGTILRYLGSRPDRGSS